MKDNPTVLIAENDYLVSEAIKKCLHSLGFPVVGKASDGLEAIRMTCHLAPEVVLMDIKMPNMDGLTATRKIQSTCPTPVVILSAHETPDLVKDASEAGASYYCIKPPQPRELERAILIARARHNDLMELRKVNEELLAAQKEIKNLREILPVCSSCKKIRDEKGAWKQMEVYIAEHSNVTFSHSICMQCCKKLYGDEDWFGEILSDDDLT